MYKEIYNSWINSGYIDYKTKEELKAIRDEKEIEDRFYKNLEFGTGGLRGIMGAGTNRINIYTIGLATQGLAKYVIKNYGNDASVTIGYDSRNMSKEFAERAAAVLCANKIKVNLFEALRPTPMLSYAVRYLNSKVGIVITASHNPKEYNGYKVYGEDGAQFTDKGSEEVLSYINEINDFSTIKVLGLKEAKENGLLSIIGEEVDKSYIDRVKELTIRKEMVKNNASDLKVIYTPIHGSGNIPVRRVLSELGYNNLSVVREQELPDGDFPTVNYPNPEQAGVFNLALKMAKNINPDIIFGTDPDSDRIGIVVKDNMNEYRVLSGNQTGVLLSNYIISSLSEEDKLASNGAIIKTIVTSEMVREVASDFNVKVIDVLTGFKYIGEKIKEFEESNSNTYLFGYEESYGCLAGTFVRDKDAVSAVVLICEMAVYYKLKGMTLYDALISLYEKYGFYKEDVISIELSGKEGQEKIQKAIDILRNSSILEVNGVKIRRIMDYKLSIEKDLIYKCEKKIELPKSNVLRFILEDKSWFVVRPSGTEPKIKIYVSVVGDSIEDADSKVNVFKKCVMKIINEAFK